MKSLLNFYRKCRVSAKKLINLEPSVPVVMEVKQEFHGSSYGGWSIPAANLSSESVVVDVGLGEDISFSTSIIDRYQCVVHGFDPTPRSIEYVEKLDNPKFRLNKVGVAAISARAMFYLPNNELHVSGSISRTTHTGLNEIEVDLITIDDVLARICEDHIDLLKIDIEGAEYDLLMSECFARHASKIGILCIEFHHRWANHGVKATEQAVVQLNKLGFRCTWFNEATNEEFTFQRF